MTMVIDERFEGPAIVAALHWYNEPARRQLVGGRLVIWPDARTDFWQRTHYGFSADTGHFLHLTLRGDFVATTKVRFQPLHRYDQAGLMVRLSPHCWLKTSVEYEPDGPSKLGAVVTNGGCSDWSTQDYHTLHDDLELRIRRERGDYLVEYRAGHNAVAQHSQPEWTQLRLTHLADDTGEQPISCGVYACSPTAAGYAAAFDYLMSAAGRIDQADEG